MSFGGQRSGGAVSWLPRPPAWSWVLGVLGALPLSLATLGRPLLLCPGLGAAFLRPQSGQDFPKDLNQMLGMGIYTLPMRVSLLGLSSNLQRRDWCYPASSRKESVPNGTPSLPGEPHRPEMNRLTRGSVAREPRCDRWWSQCPPTAPGSRRVHITPFPSPRAQPPGICQFPSHSY